MAQETWKPQNPQVEAQPSLRVEEIKKDNVKEWKPNHDLTEEHKKIYADMESGKITGEQGAKMLNDSVKNAYDEAHKKPNQFNKGDTVRVAKEFGDNTRDFEITDVKDQLKGIEIKEKGRDGLRYNVDKSQLEGYEPNNYSETRVKPEDNPETYLSDAQKQNQRDIDAEGQNLENWLNDPHDYERSYGPLRVDNETDIKKLKSLLDFSKKWNLEDSYNNIAERINELEGQQATSQPDYYDELAEAVADPNNQEIEIGDDLSLYIYEPKGYRSLEDKARAGIALIDNRTNTEIDDMEIFGDFDSDYLKELQEKIDSYNKERERKKSQYEGNPRKYEAELLDDIDSYFSKDDYKQQALNGIQWRGTWDVADMVRREEWLGPYGDYDYDSKTDEQLSDEFYAAVEDGLIDGKTVFEAILNRMSDDEVKEFGDTYELYL